MYRWMDKSFLFFFNPQQLVHIHVIIMRKEEGAGLGFSIAGGSDSESKAPTVSSAETLPVSPLYSTHCAAVRPHSEFIFLLRFHQGTQSVFHRSGSSGGNYSERR